ncbi:PREDICTED: protein FAM160B2-like, partial [Nanorana parkeri]|uniref:protein FAM160B2-like n=1 Tax=Nanorana parkeri TaxID=125878 RepID=UPI0008543938
MWNRLGAFLQQAVEPREPAQDLLQSFVHHWKGVTQYYLETTDEACPARNTDIPWRLRQLLDILVYEEGGSLASEGSGGGDKGGSADSTGPCMEYLLQHKILETLCTLAKAEYPPGMRQQVLVFFSRLLAKVQRPLLHYINVHRPVQGELVKRTISNEEDNEPATGSASCKPKQTLFRALLRLCLCQKGRLAVRAKETLLGVLRTAQQEAPARIIAHSDLSQQLSERLCDLHDDIPLSAHPCDITSQEDTNWRTEVSKEEFDATPPETAAVRRFLGWVEFCNSLLQESHEMVAASIAKAITEVYLQGKLQDELLQVSELRILRSTALLTALLQRLNSSALLRPLLIFLLGEEGGPEKRSDKPPPLRSQLIQRCNHLSDEISLTTMRLFEEMFLSSDSMVLNSLVLRNLENRRYLSGGSEESRAQDGEAFEGTDELEEDPYFTDGLPDTGPQMMGRNQRHHGESMGAEQSMR